MPHRRVVRLLRPLLAAALIAASLAHAQEGGRVKFSIPAQAAPKALEAYAKQANVQILFPHDLVASLELPALAGEYTPMEAVNKLLEGTGLRAEQVSPGILTIKRAGDRVNKSERLEVTGSRLARAAVEGAQEVRTYTRERIDRSGQTTLTEFLSTLPEVSLNSAESTFVATSVRLRGLPEGSALVLVNGRRVQSTTGSAAAFGFFDLNLIPLGAVERVDVLPTGTSAIYGGDALAGVVNIILKKDFDGAGATVGYKHAENTEERNASIAAGWSGDRASLSLIASFSDRTSLLGASREITADADFRRFGGADRRSNSYGIPGTVFAVTGNLPGLNATQAGIPVGSTGIGLRPSDFLATAGIVNRGSASAYLSLVPASERAGIFVAGSYRISDRLEAFAELMYSDVKIDVEGAPPILTQALVPASNAFNPFGANVRVNNLVAAAGPSVTRYHDEFSRPVVGVRGRLDEWSWEASYLESKDEGTSTRSKVTHPARLAAALASSDPATAYNPFVDGPQGSPALLASIFGESAVDSFASKSRLVNAYARGPTLQLPAGPLEVAFGGEGERSSLSSFSFGLTSASRRSKAFFLEARAPLLGGPGRETVALHAAVRRDDYSDFGAKTTPQAGLEIRPTPDLLLRATYGEGFRPPTLYNLYAPVSRSPLTAIDPLRNNEVVPVDIIFGGNPALAATTGESSTLGAVYSPRQVPGLSVSLTAWQLDFENAISIPDRQFIVDNEASFPGRVVREPASGGLPGRIVSVDYSYINFGATRQAGFDAAFDWQLRTPVGELRPAAAVTYMSKFKGTSTPGGPPVDRLSRANQDGVYAPRVKATTSLAWKPVAPLSISVAGRYIGNYVDYNGLRKIGDFWYVDGAVEVKLGQLFGWKGPGLSSARLAIAATNLADKLPVFSTYPRGFDPYNYDLVGRTVLVRLSMGL